MNYQPIHILMAEDDPQDQLLVQTAFDEARVVNNLEIVGDGEDLLAYLRHEGKHAETNLPDLILLDLNMPRMDGRQALAEIKRDPVLRRIPVVILTTSAAKDC
jgi:two-component system response regulator